MQTVLRQGCIRAYPKRMKYVLRVLLVIQTASAAARTILLRLQKAAKLKLNLSAKLTST